MPPVPIAPQEPTPPKPADIVEEKQDQPMEEDGEREQSESDDEPMEKDGEWIEKKGKGGKGKGKRGRPKGRPGSDSSEVDTNGRKKFIVPGQGHDLLDAQGDRTRSRSRSAAKPAGGDLQRSNLIAFGYAQGSVVHIEANPDAKRLYDDLLSNYNRLIRPVVNNTETLTVWLGLKLSQLIEVSLRNQVMTTNLWVKQKWFDYKLKWDPEEYGGVEMLYVPSEQIWLPDIVLYNNWDGNYEVTLMTKATLKYTGEVFWEPPAIYKSSCEMNVEYFPYDEQTCLMKFGSWTYNGAQVELRHLDQVPGSNLVQIGIDLSEFYLSVEWDILEVPASRNEEYYPCCPEPFSDITFKLTMRRKTLFYTVNLIIPCVGITFLTVLVFYLPSDSGEKVTLCISILVSLTVFFLLLAEIIPPTSLAVPLLGKYLLFTMILVSLSVWTTVCVLNVWYRSTSTHKMSWLVKRLFLEIMPKILMMRRAKYTLPDYDDSMQSNVYTNEIEMRYLGKQQFECMFVI
ncbi:acetylcholine receptor protein alpha 1, 2, 3, 4 invertebrate [Culex quinquefasciatus]|uniref:Acetylcholine receptor protein alpha 1, 2, 3, 4 invertebrate n=1 Tax=Culex quinquefasciatus TaxID=7176 RepID=B0WJI1_CULQU|nr:acetylcholine receptor protein alpha 1, 2, 3, 4 invertebrate [Culex quinquefasciatus]|eukprot:XP_001848865.1 acetylcholine receptor protein alpha 1, 2, 3, 4 invertebrate [Culex quinquefasciatus]